MILSVGTSFPRGFLHGFQALTAVTDVIYRIDEFSRFEL
jgi:hypothetical protein